MSKILIIEDDSEIAMLERDYLEIEGFETTVIADGEAAASGSPSAAPRLPPHRRPAAPIPPPP